MARHTTRAGNRGGEGSTALLEKVIEFYRKSLLESGRGMDWLKRLGLGDAGLIDATRAGFCDGTLAQAIPAAGGMRDELKALGILAADDTERFLACIVLPVLDPDGRPVGLCGQPIAKDELLLTPGCPTALWNAPALALHPEIYLADGLVETLSLKAAGLPNVCGLLGVEGLDADAETLRRHGVRRLTLVGFRPDDRRPDRLAPVAACLRKLLPDGASVNACLQAYGPERTVELIEAAQPDAQRTPPAPEPAVERLADTPGALERRSFAVSFASRHYEVRGLERDARRLRATLRTEHAGRLFVDGVDFYCARSRETLCRNLCRHFEAAAELIEADIGRLVRACERYQPGEAAAQPAPAMTEAERCDAESFARDPRLLDRIREDYATCGLVGEEANKLLCYLAMTSRKMEDPLSMLILSSSGAGKSALQDATLAFCPPEDQVRLTSLTGKALFYKQRDSLKHKLLALEEGTGAEQASYAIRTLISARELIIETTVKDPGSGRLTTAQNRVEGPAAVFLTTTDPDVDPETRSRFFVIGVDESREQTRAILESQRRRQTLEGQTRGAELDAVVRRHRNFQRLLRPVRVVNPFADKLVYGDDRLQSRRDQPKHLNLIRAVAFLRQLTREAKPGKTPYIEATAEDVRDAGQLARETMGRNLGDLTRVSRDLLRQLALMVGARQERFAREDGANVPARSDIRFTRRDIREYTGWNHVRVMRYLRQLVELEYVVAEGGRLAGRYTYRLLYDGDGNESDPYLPGLRAGGDEKELTA